MAAQQNFQSPKGEDNAGLHSADRIIAIFWLTEYFIAILFRLYHQPEQAVKGVATPNVSRFRRH
jgi:hypothetical protein